MNRYSSTSHTLTSTLTTPDSTTSPKPGLRHTIRLFILRLLLRTLSLFSPRLRKLLNRLGITGSTEDDPAGPSPGLPVDNPTESYWQLPRSVLARWGSGQGEEEKEGEEGFLVKETDIVVIGSGITGVSVVRTLLDHSKKGGEGGEEFDIVMIEAREVCSGATGRNGGHITPVLYDHYEGLKATYGSSMAQKMIRFRLAHLPTLMDVAREEGLLGDEASQCREVEECDVFWDENTWKESKRRLGVYKDDMPLEGGRYKVVEKGDVDIEDLGLCEKTKGVLRTQGGAVHPYRFVTGILERLLREYEKRFRLYTCTPCTEVKVSEVDGIEVYEVVTPRGTIRTKHVVHATNGWLGHLVPGMRGKIIPARGVMTAQSVERTKWAGKRSFVFFPENGTHTYDYLTQMPIGSGRTGKYPRPEGEMMLGGAFAKGDIVEEMGNSDDSGWDKGSAKHLGTALSGYFEMKSKVKSVIMFPFILLLLSFFVATSAARSHSLSRLPHHHDLSQRITQRSILENPGNSTRVRRTRRSCKPRHTSSATSTHVSTTSTHTPTTTPHSAPTTDNSSSDVNLPGVAFKPANWPSKTQVGASPTATQASPSDPYLELLSEAYNNKDNDLFTSVHNGQMTY
ncbi:hypothetical protein H0H93_005008 [Arthromyces matolae]|nr:hypothetical protein H0H93_005008 [Arthromyces matolae]